MRNEMYLENGMLLDDTERDDHGGAPQTEDHWSDWDWADLEDFMDSYELTALAFMEWIGMKDTDDADYDHLETAYDALDASTQMSVLENYVEAHDLQDSFNLWWEARHGW